MIKYISTRGREKSLTSAQAIIKGIAEDGGLYVPDQIPKLDINPTEIVEELLSAGKAPKKDGRGYLYPVKGDPPVCRYIHDKR